MPLIFETLEGLWTTRGTRLACNGYAETYCSKSGSTGSEWFLALAMGGSWSRGEQG
jgi:hypothetical protein